MESHDNVKENKNSIKDNIIVGYIFEFLKENKIWAVVTLLVVFITNPLEMILLSDLFSNFTTSINKKDYDGSMSNLWKIAGVYTLIESMNVLSSYFDTKYYPMLEKFVRFKLIDVIFKNIEVNYDNENVSDTILKILNIPNIVTTTTQSFIYWFPASIPTSSSKS